jgi:hypothetical protein
MVVTSSSVTTFSTTIRMGGPPTSPPVVADAASPSGGPRFSAGDPAYEEPGETCDDLADVSDIRSDYQPGAVRDAAEGLAKRRYASGLAFLQAQDDKMLAGWFGGEPVTFGAITDHFDTAVHEGSHIWVAKHFDPRKVTYPVRADLAIETRRLRNFDRSEILALLEDAANDTYATTYLTGASGAQGFNSLLDEYDAYTHSLASRYCTRDFVGANQRVSARDGILAMMHFVEVYLRLAREKHPADYAAILADPGHIRLILTVWSRAELWLRRSAPYASLGIRDTELERFAYAADGLAEISRLRDVDGSTGPR